MKYIVGLVLFMMLASNLLAQYQLPDVTLPSPNAASLGLYGEVPVSHFTGIPNVQIPVYTLAEGGVEVPISLQYHASGVRPDQHPGWVGVNWNLNAGGTITRVTKGMPDEFDTPGRYLEYYGVYGDFHGEDGGQKGYYFNHNLLYNTDWSDPTYIEDNLIHTFGPAADSEPDEFKFNFMGHSGSFFIGEGGEWKVKSESNIKVVFDDSNFIDLPEPLQVSYDHHPAAFCGRFYQNMKSFGGFTLITDDGTQYVFGSTSANASTDAIEYSIPFWGQLYEQWIATSWNLVKIQKPTGQVVDFTYSPDDYVANMHVSFSITLEQYLGSDGEIICGGVGGATPFGNEGENYIDVIGPKYASYSGSLIRPVYLESIETSNTKISFFRSTTTELRYPQVVFENNYTVADEPIERFTCFGEASNLPFLYDVIPRGGAYWRESLDALQWKKLDEIIVESNNSNKEIGRFNLKYNNQSSERLFLNSITQIGPENKIKNAVHSFDYYEGTLPDYLSESVDHWGFYKGVSNPYFTRPRTEENIIEILEDWQSVIDGDNPDFFKALRDATNDVTVANIGSLKEITYPTGGKTSFEYEKNSYSKYLNSERTALEDKTASSLTVGGLRIKKINSLSLNGSPITKEYLYVASYDSDKDLSTLKSSGQLGGGVQYTWHYNAHDGVEQGDVTEVEKSILSVQNHLPMSNNCNGTHIGYSEVVEKLGDGSYSIYKFTNFESEDGDHFDEIETGGLNLDRTHLNTSYTNKYYERGKPLFIENFDSEDHLVNQKKFTYTPVTEHFLKAISLIFYVTSCSGPTGEGEGFYKNFSAYPYKIYFNKYMLESETTSTFSQAQGVENFVSGTTNFSYNEDHFKLKKVESVADGLNKKNVKEFIYSKDFIDPKGFLKKLNDNNINALVEELEYQTSLDDSKEEILSGKITTYRSEGLRNKVYSFEPENIIQYDDYNSSLELTNELLPGSTKVFDFNPDFKEIVSFNEYDDKGNLLEFKGRDGIDHTLIWGYNNTLLVAHLQGAARSDVESLAEFGEDYDLFNGGLTTNQKNELRDELSSAFITIYDHDPGIGVVKVTDANGQNVRYEYDEFRRLKLVKDHQGNFLERYRYNFYNSESAPILAIQSCSVVNTTWDFEVSNVLQNHGDTQITWDFGDGTVIEDGGRSVSHIYESTGTYELILTIQNDEYETVCETRTITVKKPVDAYGIFAAPRPHTGSFELTAIIETVGAAHCGAVDYFWQKSVDNGNTWTSFTSSREANVSVYDTREMLIRVTVSDDVTSVVSPSILLNEGGTPENGPGDPE